MDFEVTIIGAGVIGLSIAKALSKKRLILLLLKRIIVLERKQVLGIVVLFMLVSIIQSSQKKLRFVSKVINYSTNI